MEPTDGDHEAGPAPAARPGQPLLPWSKLAVAAPMVILALVLSLVRIPYFVISPGPAEDVLPKIEIQEHQTYPVRGHLLLTAVYVQHATVYGAVRGWLDGSEAVVPSRAVLAPGESPQQEVRRSLSEMDTSKIDAAVVALTRYTEYPKVHGRGVLVESVFGGTPAEGHLFAGDLILSVDGTSIRDVDQLGQLIRQTEVGHPLTFHIEAAGESHDVSIAPVRVPNVDYPIIGISSVNNFPFPLSIQSGNIGGPSAGLMWTLGLADLLTPGDMTGGRIIAGTGTIAPDGSVGPIGAIGEKVIAAERAGAGIFFAPVKDAPAARAAAVNIVVVPVDSYTDAIDYLAAHP